MIDRAKLLDALIADPAKADALTRDEARALAVTIAPLVKALELRALSAQPAPAPTSKHENGALLSAPEAAALLGVPIRWLYRHARGLPFTRRLGHRTLRFDARGLDRWIAKQRPPELDP